MDKNYYEKCLFEVLEIMHKIQTRTKFCVSYYYHGSTNCLNFNISHSKVQYLADVFKVHCKIGHVNPYIIQTVTIQDGLAKLKEFCKENNIDLGGENG